LIGLGATNAGVATKASVGPAVETFAHRNVGLSGEEIQALAEDIPPGTTGLLVLFEHRWATRLKEAVRNSGGVVLAQGMVCPEALLAVGADLAAIESAADQYETPRGT